MGGVRTGEREGGIPHTKPVGLSESGIRPNNSDKRYEGMPSSCDCTYSPHIRVYLRIDADGLADVIEAVPFQQFGKAAFQHGDLLWTAIHQGADEHDQA